MSSLQQEGSYGIEGDTSNSSGSSPWRRVPQPHIAREFSGMAAWKRDGLVLVGGSSLDGKKQCLGSVEVFNFSSRSWTLLEATLHRPRRHCAVTIVGDRFLYVIGGNSNCDRSFIDLDTVERLDLLHPHKFVVLSQRLPFPVRNAVAVPWQSRIFIVGGYCSAHENEAFRKKHGSHSSSTVVSGYCRNLWVLDTNIDHCIKLQNLAQPRWLPAVSIVRGNLVVAGGYDGNQWLSDVETYHVLRAQGTEDLSANQCPIPCIPATAPKVRAFWTRMNQLSVLCESNMIYTWDWGSTKWRTEQILAEDSYNAPAWKADDLSVPRSVLSANCVVFLDSNRILWELNRPCYNTASVGQLNAELLLCETDIQKAAKVGFWELSALDKAAAAHARIPRIKAMLNKLDTIQWLQKQKDSLVQGFVLSQSSGAWDDCKNLALDIRDVEEELDQAHSHLCELESGQCVAGGETHAKDALQEQGVTGTYCSPLRRTRPMLMKIAKGESPRILTNVSRRSVGDGVSTDDDSATVMEKVYDGASLDITSIADLELSASMIIEDIPFHGEPTIEDDRPRPTPLLRRQSSLLLQSLLSARDLKELARSSEQQSVDAVFM